MAMSRSIRDGWIQATAPRAGYQRDPQALWSLCRAKHSCTLAGTKSGLRRGDCRVYWNLLFSAIKLLTYTLRKKEMWDKLVALDLKEKRCPSCRSVDGINCSLSPQKRR